MTSQPARISAVVVSYNVCPLLKACLESLERSQDAGELDEIVVVDSSSSDGSVRMVREQFPGAVLQVVTNRGFGAGVNAGLASSSGDAILILNPDTVVCPGAVRALSTALFSSPDVGLVGPQLRHPDGIPQPSRRRFPTAWTPVFESTILEEWLPGNRWVRRYRMLEDPDHHEVTVDWLVGAALMVRREVAEQAGGFDESFWLYGEELEWCYRIRRHGWHIRYVPDAAIIHHEGSSTRQDRLKSRLEFDRGRVRAQCVIHGERVARRTARMLRINFAIHLAREGLKLLLGHRRELRRQRVSRYWTLLRSELYD